MSSYAPLADSSFGLASVASMWNVMPQTPLCTPPQPSAHCQMDRLPTAPCLGIVYSRIRNLFVHRRGNADGRSLDNATLVRPSLVGVYGHTYIT